MCVRLFLLTRTHTHTRARARAVEPMADPWAVLGVRPGASHEEVSVKWKKMTKKKDRAGGLRRRGAVGAPPSTSDLTLSPPPDPRRLPPQGQGRPPRPGRPHRPGRIRGPVQAAGGRVRGRAAGRGGRGGLALGGLALGGGRSRRAAGGPPAPAARRLWQPCPGHGAVCPPGPGGRGRRPRARGAVGPPAGQPFPGGGRPAEGGAPALRVLAAARVARGEGGGQ